MNSHLLGVVYGIKVVWEKSASTTRDSQQKDPALLVKETSSCWKIGKATPTIMNGTTMSMTLI